MCAGLSVSGKKHVSGLVRGHAIGQQLASILSLPSGISACCDEPEHTLHLLQQRACVSFTGSVWEYAQAPFEACLHDEDCPGFASGEVWASLHRGTG